MDKVLKQRLIGAAILIALAVIFLPMLFQAPEEDPQDRRLTLDLPEAPAGGREQVRRLPLDPDEAREPEAVERTDSGPALPPDTGDGEAGESETPAPVEPAGGEEAPGTPPREQGEEAPEREAAPQTDESPPETDREGDWLVQVAVFSSAETAAGIAERLETLGHSARREELVRDEAELHRVLAGPYADEADAERVRGQIAATVAGVTPEVRRRTDDDGGEETRTPEASGYSVQVGSFASENNARRLRAQLADAGYDAFVHEDQSSSRTIWRVRVGIYQQREPAGELLEELRQRMSLDGLVVSQP